MAKDIAIKAFFSMVLLILSAVPIEAAKYTRTVENYQVPDVVLIDQHGKEISFQELIGQSRPVLLDFIYGTCTTICPVLSAGFSNLQRKLEQTGQTAQLISISIDPEHDTPEVMREYLERYRARPGWQFLTGKREDIDRVMRAFDAYVSNKMSHYPMTLLKVPDSTKWVRIYGLIGTKDLLSEYHSIHGE